MFPPVEAWDRETGVARFLSCIISEMLAIRRVALDAVSAYYPFFFISAIYGLAHGFYFYPDSVYRTRRSFPHRLTIPAFEECFAVLQCFFACIICFSSGDMQAPGNAGTIIMALPVPSHLQVFLYPQHL